MNESILTREEVQEIDRKCDITFFVPDDSETFPGTYVNLRQLRDYAARIEAAVLGKVFGEPIYQISDWPGIWTDVTKQEFDQTHHARIVYALTRSKP